MFQCACMTFLFLVKLQCDNIIHQGKVEISIVELEGRKRGDHPALVLKIENPPCSFGLAQYPFQDI